LICLFCCRKYCMWINPADIYMKLEIGTEAAHFPEKEFINGIFVAVQAI
jgi:hypothetical protein